MTSSATTRNRLEKQGTGDNANTWGTYLNSSIDLIDAALDGRTAFSLSGSKTLTSVNYAADESRERFLDITGGTGGTVTIPAVEKWYIVRNASSGDVVFTTGSGVTQTVKSGSVTLLVSDGTNIRAGVDKGYVDALVANTAFATALPSQTGNSGKFVTTDGMNASWASLSAVAMSGAYADLTGTPALATVATSGSYADLTGKPTLPSGAIVGTTDTQTLTNKTIAFASNTLTGVAPLASPTFTGTVTTATADLLGSVRGNVTAVAASEIDCSLGNYFTKTASGSLTWTVTNVPSSRSYSFLLELTNGGTGTQTWFSGIKWPGGTAPILTASGVDVLGFITDDGGTTWRGVQLMKDSK